MCHRRAELANPRDNSSMRAGPTPAQGVGRRGTLVVAMPTPWLLALALAAAPDDAAAEPGPAVAAVDDQLTIEPGATCLRRERLLDQVVHWLGSETVDARLTIEVTGVPGDERAVLVVLRDRGTSIAERPFESLPADCGDAHAAVGLAIAMAIDATVLESLGVQWTPPPPPPAPIDPPPAPVEPEPAPPPSRPDPPPPDREPTRMQIHGRVGGVFTVGSPPGLGGGGEVGVELGFREIVDLHLGALAATSGRRTLDADQGTSVSASLVGGRLDVCTGPWVGKVRPRACTGLVAGAAIAAGRGFVLDRTVALPWVAMALSGDVRVRLTSRLQLEFGLDGLVTAVQPGLDVESLDGPQPVRDFGRFSIMAGVGVVIGFR